MGRKLLLVVVVLAASSLAVGTASRLTGQDKKVKGRLPPYYAQIVTDQQREVIYVLQAKYGQQIEALKQQIEMLEKQCDVEVENVLSPQQKILLAKLMEDAATKRKKSSDDKIAAKVAEVEAAKAAEEAKAQAANGKKGRVKKEKN